MLAQIEKCRRESGASGCETAQVVGQVDGMQLRRCARDGRDADYLWTAIGRAGEQPLIRTPCFQVNTPGLYRWSEKAIRDAFCEAWKETDGGRRSSLTEAMNVQVFEKTDVGRKLTVAWSGHDISDRDWLDVRRSFRVNFLMGEVGAIPETCVFWYRAASGSELH